MSYGSNRVTSKIGVVYSLKFFIITVPIFAIVSVLKYRCEISTYSLFLSFRLRFGFGFFRIKNSATCFLLGNGDPAVQCYEEKYVQLK